MDKIISDMKEKSETIINKAHKRMDAAHDKAQIKIDTTQDKMDDILASKFPAFRLRTSIIASLVFLNLILVTTILDSFGLSEGFSFVESGAVLHYLVYFLLFNLGIPLLIINIFIAIYLKPVQEQYKKYFVTKRIEDEKAYWKGVARFDKLGLRLGTLIGLLYIIGNPWGLEFSTSGGLTILFYSLSRISLVLVSITANVLCLHLFVRRRLLYVLDVYELKTKVKSYQTQSFQNIFVGIVLLVNALFVFTDVSLRIADQGRSRMDHIQARALNMTGGGNKLTHAPGQLSPPSGELSPPPLEVSKLAKGYSILLLLIVFQSSLIFAILAVLHSRQSRDLQRKMVDLSDGSGDLTRQIRILEIDDQAIIVSHLNKFIRNLRKKLLTVENATQRVSSSSDTLLEELQNTSAATEEMVASVEQINKTTNSRASVVDDTSKNLISMIDSLEQVKLSVDTQASFVEQTSSAINEMAASIQSVSQATGKANTLSGHLSEAASDGGKAVNASIAAIRDVENSSDEVNTLVTTITKIAGQTNMLAMNAAIEAAHAGDAGRGFAVVAEEVRNLAESSSGSAKQITQQIQQMVDLVNNGVNMSESAGDALHKVLDDISQTTELINGIAMAMDEQNTGATEILNSITALVDATQTIKKISTDELSKNLLMRRSIEQVVQAFEEIRLATEEQTQGTRDMISFVNQLQNVAHENQEIVKILSHEFTGFKLK